MSTRKQLGLPVGILVSVVVLIGLATISKDPPAAPAASASAKVKGPPSAEPLPSLVLKDFSAIGLRFQYPEPYRVETSTDNPKMHQVALDDGAEPGVVTIRYNPEEPGKALVLDDIAKQMRSVNEDGNDALLGSAKLKIAGKELDARTLKYQIFGVHQTDTVAVVTINGNNYLVLTHEADEDQPRVQRLFDTVLGSLKAK